MIAEPIARPIIAQPLARGLVASSGAAVDPDAAAFFTRAVNKLVLDCKATGIWSKMIALYPFVGGTAGTHKYNLKSSSFSITFNINAGSGDTHNAMGWTGALSSFSTTGVVPATHTTPNSLAYGVYSRTNSDVQIFDLGAEAPPGTVVGFWLQQPASGVVYYYNATPLHSATWSDSSGFFICSRASSSQLKMFRNGIQLGSTYTEVQGPLPTADFRLSQCFDGTSVPHQMALVFISDGLSDAEVASFNTAIQTFQTTLGRQV
jgi:hypothetical protein